MGYPVFLVGEASEVGRAQGQLQRAILSERIERTLRRADESGTTPLLRERADRFGMVVQEAAPHWLDEAEALASSAGVETWHLLAINCLSQLPGKLWSAPYVPAPLDEAPLTAEMIDVYEAQGVEAGLGGGDCTAFFALGEASVSGETIFHKNREERDEVQCVYIKGVEGNHRFAGGGDIGNLGTAHLHTENFWAGANNTGSAVPPAEYQDGALNDSHALRFFAENCRALDDIVPATETLIANGWLGGGGHNRGSIFVFADARRGLVVEATSRRLAHRWFDGDAMAVRTNHFVLPEMQPYAEPPHPGSVRRYERATALWQAQHGLAGLSLCGEIARDRDGAPQAAICRNPSDGAGGVTVSTSSATISTHDDRRCQTHFRNGHPSYTPGVILSPLDRVCDSDLVSGAHCQQSRRYRGWV